MKGKTFLAILLIMESLLAVHSEMQILQHWNTIQMQGYIRYQMNRDKNNGWKLVVTFSEPIFNIQVNGATLKGISDDGKVITLKNPQYLMTAPAGTNLEIPFSASSNSSSPPQGTVFMPFDGSTTTASIGSNSSTSAAPPATSTVPSTASTAPPTTSTAIPSTSSATSTSTTQNSAVSQVLSEDKIFIVHSWPSGDGTRFIANLKYRFKVDLNSGWILVITFSKPVSNYEIYNADLVTISEDGLQVFIKNKDYNGKQKAGALMEMEFQTSTTGSAPPTGTVHIQGDNVPSPTSGPLTTTTTSSSTTVASNDKYNYKDALHKSILFFEAQRSGKLSNTNRISWRSDSALNDRGNGGEDLTGGWYDAGDFVKFGFPMASAVTTLAWGLIEFENAYQAAGELEYMVDSIKWPLDYFMKAHVKDNEFYGQVGDGHVDHAYWGRPEDMTMHRPAWKIDPSAPGSDLAGETAAALAAGSIALKAHDSEYANKLLDHAKALYNFAYTCRGKYSDAISNAQDFYGSTNYFDELTWGAAWLYYATGEQHYLNKANEFYSSDLPWAYSWDEKSAGNQLLLAILTDGEKYKSDTEKFLQSWFPGGSIPYTPKGLAWRSKWGANRYAANTAFLAMIAAKHGIKKQESESFAKGQIDYMLGDTGRSFVVGFGVNPPTRPHHAAASCPSTPNSCGWDYLHTSNPNPHELTGALVGGPGQNDDYQDVRNDYVKNEVTCDYNAGFQGTLAGLIARNL